MSFFRLTEYRLPPLTEAIGAFCLIPVLALIFLLVAGMLVIAWPIVPVLVYIYNSAEDKADAEVDAGSAAMVATMDEKS